MAPASRTLFVALHFIRHITAKPAKTGEGYPWQKEKQKTRPRERRLQNPSAIKSRTGIAKWRRSARNAPYADRPAKNKRAPHSGLSKPLKTSFVPSAVPMNAFTAGKPTSLSGNFITCCRKTGVRRLRPGRNFVSPHQFQTAPSRLEINAVRTGPA